MFFYRINRLPFLIYLIKRFFYRNNNSELNYMENISFFMLKKSRSLFFNSLKISSGFTMIKNQIFSLRSSGFRLYNFTINVPNKELAHANHLRVKSFGLSLSNDSCIKPVPASVVLRYFKH